MTTMEVSMKAGIRLMVAAGAILTLGAMAGSPAAGAGTVGKSTSCNLTADQAESLGASYVLPLKVKNTSCGKGQKVAKAFNECRKDHGGRNGHCKSQVLGYKCDEGKRTYNGTRTQYYAHVVCKNGSKKVIFDYTQDL
jgi:hypothetical protein